MRFLILGYHGHYNTGDNALLWTILRGLARLRPEATFLVIGEPASFSFPPELASACTVWRPRRGIMLKALVVVDRVVYAGGGIFQDYGMVGTRGVRTIFLVASLARLLGRPTYFLFVSVGCLQTKMGRFYTRTAIRIARATILRDRPSLERAAVTESSRVLLAADPSSLLPREASSRPESRVLGVSAFPYFEHVMAQPEEDERLLGLLDRMIQAAHAGGFERVRFITMHGGRRDEVPFFERLAGRLGGIPYEIVPYSPDPTVAVAQIGDCGAVIAMRLHALIFAYLTEVPAVALSYHEKIDAFLTEVGLEEISMTLETPLDEAASRVQFLLKCPPSPTVQPEDYACLADQGIEWLRGKL